jgi:hypothetical protein
MSGIAVAESTARKKGPKTLDHLEIHPQLGGGHIVKHVYTGYEHDAKEVKFNADGKSQGGEHIMKHLTKHAGLPLMSNAEGNGDETEPEEQESD